MMIVVHSILCVCTSMEYFPRKMLSNRSDIYFIGFPLGQLKAFSMLAMKIARRNGMEWQVKMNRLKMDYKGIAMQCNAMK